MVTVSPHLPPRRSRWTRTKHGGAWRSLLERRPGTSARSRFKNEHSFVGEAAGNRSDLEPPLGGWPKRMLDIGIALSATVALAPLILIAALLIKLTMGGPVIYAHPRIGHKGRMFRCFKFRTMVPLPEEKLIKFLASHPEAEREWRETHKLKNDPRVTFVGRLLRVSSLDELPQLLNVLRGEMSCVGPRPIVTAELSRYGVHASEYLSSRPGLTGLWQVSGRSHTSYARRVALDCEYVRTWSIWLDLSILLRTVLAVLRFHQAS